MEILANIHDWIYGVRPRARWLSKQILSNLPQGSVVLNVGAGNGYIEKELEKSNIKITSLEPYPKKQLPNLVKEKFEDAVFDKKFDGIIFCDSLHHVDSPILSITKALSLLTSNGKLFILEIAPKNVFLKVLLFDSRILCHYRKHTWTKKSFEKIIKSSGGKIEKTIMHNINAPLFIVTNKHD